MRRSWGCDESGHHCDSIRRRVDEALGSHGSEFAVADGARRNMSTCWEPDERRREMLVKDWYSQCDDTNAVYPGSTCGTDRGSEMIQFNMTRRMTMNSKGE